jgi:hypothetical protein
MATWTVKSQTDDLARALEIVGDQRAEGYTVWIENESGEVVDERTLETGTPSIKTTRTLEWLGAPLFISAFIILGLIVLYLIGLWVDR